MEANPALRAVLVHMHPGDARAVEETMAKRLGSGQGRMRRFYTTLPHHSSPWAAHGWTGIGEPPLVRVVCRGLALGASSYARMPRQLRK